MVESDYKIFASLLLACCKQFLVDCIWFFFSMVSVKYHNKQEILKQSLSSDMNTIIKNLQ